SRITQIRESLIARRPGSSPGFPAKPMTSSSPITTPNQQLAHSLRATIQSRLILQFQVSVL
ncbi:MAG: hypothetical protein ACM35F_05270, partial [Betaproteobacteria bacterium]